LAAAVEAVPPSEHRRPFSLSLSLSVVTREEEEKEEDDGRKKKEKKKKKKD
jgi:hypothetical protein